jgi:hypothetical protein
MTKWRSATTALVADLAAALDGPPGIQPAVVHLLAAAGNASRHWSDTVAARIGQSDRTRAMAIWALARGATAGRYRRLWKFPAWECRICRMPFVA